MLENCCRLLGAIRKFTKPAVQELLDAASGESRSLESASGLLYRARQLESEIENVIARRRKQVAAESESPSISRHHG